MKKAIMNIIDNIRTDANREIRVIRVISKVIPDVECLRSWQSYDRFENLITKELHIEFTFLGNDFAFVTTADSKWKLESKGEYLASFWWDAGTGRLSMSRNHERKITKIENHIIDNILEVVIRTSETKEKRWALPREIKYGKYIVYPCNAEIICKDTNSGKSWRVFNTQFGMRGWDTEFPVDIKRILETNFIRK